MASSRLLDGEFCDDLGSAWAIIQIIAVIINMNHHHILDLI